MSVLRGKFEDQEYTLIASNFFSFTDAVNLCASLKVVSLPASFQSTEELEFLVSFVNRMQTIETEPKGFWTGVIRLGDTGGIDAAEFSMIDFS